MRIRFYLNCEHLDLKMLKVHQKIMFVTTMPPKLRSAKTPKHKKLSSTQ